MKNWVWCVAFLLSLLGFFIQSWIGFLWMVSWILFAYVSPLIHPFFIAKEYKE